ncbi:MAG: hypothetical protein AB2A00_37160 [Myxococcota bacterium]
MRPVLLTLVLVVAACSQGSSSPPPPPVAMLSVSSDGRPAGPSLHVEGEAADNVVTLRVVATDLGGILGFSYHLRYDPTRLRILDTDVRRAQPAVLGPDAVMLAVDRQGDVSLGGTRSGARNGPAHLEGAVTVLELRVEPLVDGESAVGIQDVVVRRVDGALVPVQVAGARVVRGQS